MPTPARPGVSRPPTPPAENNVFATAAAAVAAARAAGISCDPLEASVERLRRRSAAAAAASEGPVAVLTQLAKLCDNQATQAAGGGVDMARKARELGLQAQELGEKALSAAKASDQARRHAAVLSVTGKGQAPKKDRRQQLADAAIEAAVKERKKEEQRQRARRAAARREIDERRKQERDLDVRARRERRRRDAELYARREMDRRRRTGEPLPPQTFDDMRHPEAPSNIRRSSSSATAPPVFASETGMWMAAEFVSRRSCYGPTDEEEEEDEEDEEEEDEESEEEERRNQWRE
eukprot:Hpha_TRINITY_DN15790_c1_g2::TRINITY_DN15790_c1_g2_i1::g.38442::m.38442